MSLVPTIYSSADSGAPVLTGQVGSMVALLRAILVAGYGGKPALGWTEAFTGANKAVFRNSSALGSGYYTQVDDATTFYARLRSHLGMSALDVGDGNPVPTLAQWPNGMAWPKSRTNNTVARPWWVIGNERSVYLFIDNASTDAFYPYFLGDIDSLLAGDQHHFFLSSSGADAYSGSTGTSIRISTLLWPPVTSWSATMSTVTSAVCGHLARKIDQTSGAVACDHPATEYGTAAAYGSVGVSYPFASKLLHTRANVREAANVIRGTMPGLVVPLHQRPLADLSTLANVPGTPTGSTLVARNFAVGTSPVVLGQVLFVTGVEW